MSKEKLKLILLLITVGISAVIIWYAPVLFRGYSTLILRDSALLARNYSQYNIYGIEDEINITLAPSLVKEQAQEYISGNKLTPIALAWVFKLTGLPQYENLIFVSIAILVLALLIFTITVYYLFNLKTAALFSFIYILLPFNWWRAPYNFGSYEFALLFLSLFFLFFILGWKSEYRLKYLYLILAGIFLALAGIAKEAMFLIAPALLLYLFFQKQKYYLLAIFIPFIILITWLWLPDMISGHNAYRLFFKNRETQSAKVFLDYGFYSHIFPDPYTYHYDQEAFLKNYQADILAMDTDFLQKIEMSRGASFVGVKKPGLLTRLKIGIALLIRHSFGFLAIEIIGGPFIFLLLILGFIFLRKEYNYLYRFFVFWIIFVLLLLSFVTLSARNHLIDFGWIIALLVSLGLLYFINILSDKFDFKSRNKIIFGTLLSLLVLYNLVLAGHVMWGRVYDQDRFLIAPIYAQEVNKLEINDIDVIAVNIPSTEWAKLSYLTNKSMVVFAPETIEKLIKKNKLQDAFDKFGVRYILGYSPELTNQALKNTDVVNIITNDIDLILPGVSKTKSWLMNLIR